MCIMEKSEETERLEELQENLFYKNEQIQDCVCHGARYLPMVEKLANEAQEIKREINKITISQTCKNNSMVQY